MRIRLDIEQPLAVAMDVREPDAVTFGEGEYVPFDPRELPTYDGPYEVTPAGYAQVLATDGLAMAANLTINPIPSNYGLVTYDGSVITVS